VHFPHLFTSSTDIIVVIISSITIDVIVIVVKHQFSFTMAALQLRSCRGPQEPSNGLALFEPHAKCPLPHRSSSGGVKEVSRQRT
jgi:hypothetical protein